MAPISPRSATSSCCPLYGTGAEPTATVERFASELMPPRPLPLHRPVQLGFGFGEAVVDLVREMTSNSGSGAGTASSSATAAAAAADAVGTQRRTVGIEDSATQEMIAQLDRFEWKVDLKIERARKLRVADVTWMGASGSSDPYVKIELGDQIRKTKTVKKNLNPSWNQYYEFGVGKAYGAGLTDKVRLTV